MANTTPKLTIPTVHLNGTGKQDLLTPLHEAAIALREATEKLYAAYPNGRDYYPQGPNVIQTAMAEHADRINRLVAIKDEVVAMFHAIDAQGGR